jgi:hypothetical protein
MSLAPWRLSACPAYSAVELRAVARDPASSGERGVSITWSTTTTEARTIRRARVKTQLQEGRWNERDHGVAERRLVVRSSISACKRPFDFRRRPTNPGQRTSAHRRLLRMAAGQVSRRRWRYSSCMRGWPRRTRRRSTAAVSGETHLSVSLRVPSIRDAITLEAPAVSGHRQAAALSR